MVLIIIFVVSIILLTSKPGIFMFPRLITEKRNNKTYKYLVISESIRIKGKGSTTKNIARLGNINKFKKQDIENLIDGLIKIFQIDNYGLSREIEILESLEHGSIIFWRKLLTMLGLSSAIKKYIKNIDKRIMIQSEKYIEMMILNRCIEPLSKLGNSRWIERTCFTKMKGYSNLSLNVEYFYRSMDHLLKIKEELELYIFEKLQSLFSINVKLTFYDITSTFFYNENSQLCKHGYSRDNQPDKVQIVIGVVTSWEGYPIKHYVFEGNTKDESTVCEVVKDLKSNYNIEQTTFVGDRGMITKLNLSQIESDGFDYIMGMKHRQNEITKMLFLSKQINANDYKQYGELLIQEKIVSIKDFIYRKSKQILQDEDIHYEAVSFLKFKKQILELNNMDEIKYINFKENLEGLSTDKKVVKKIFNLVKKYKGQYENTLRLIICLNKKIQLLSKKKRDEYILFFTKELDKLFLRKKDGKKNNIIKKEQKLNKIFDGYKKRYKKYFSIENDTKTGEPIGYTINKKEIKEDEQFYGIFILSTNRHDLDAKKVVDSYKDLKEVEMLFNDLKHFVDIRPVRHWLEKRVRAHVFLCILALLLKRIFEINYLKGKDVIELLEEISKSKLIYYKVKSSHREDRFQIIPKITNVSTEQKKYFQMIGIRNPMNLENYLW
jgi:transposase